MGSGVRGGEGGVCRKGWCVWGRATCGDMRHVGEVLRVGRVGVLEAAGGGG